MIDQAKLNRWYELSQQLDAIKAEEITLRRELFSAAFPNPTEGTKENKFPLANGWILQGDHKITRSVDAAVVSTLRKGDNTAPLVDKVFEFKPSLKLKEYRALTQDDLNLLADAVTIKPGTPGLKIILPKR